MGAVALAMTMALPALRAHAVVFTVTTTSDSQDDANDGLCLDAFGECSLRAAITEANRTVDGDDVSFLIQGGGVSTIDLVTPLPQITTPIHIYGDGTYHQFVTTTHGVATGLDLAAGSDGSSIAYLVVSGFQTAVHVAGTNGMSLSGLRIGSNALGSSSVPNSVAGIWDQGTSTSIFNNFICSSLVGLRLAGATTGVTGNTIGSCDGVTTLPNGTGIQITGSSGSLYYPSNSVVGNSGDGIGIGGAASGWGIAGVIVSGNDGDGIHFNGTANDNTVIGADIHDNGGAGIAVGPGSRNNRFSSLVVKNNTGLGIDLLPAGDTTGVTANDAADADSGGNDLQNYPTGKAGTGFPMLRILSGGTVIQGGLSSVPNKSFTIEYYQSPSCDPSGFGEGQQVIGTNTVAGCTQVTTDATGYVDVGCQLSAGTINSGWFVSALVTGEGGTSEFSQCTSLATSMTTTTSTTIPTTSSSSTSSSSTSSSSSTTKTTTTLVGSTTTFSAPTTTTSSTIGSSSTTLGGSTTSTTSTVPATTHTSPSTTSTSSSSSSSTSTSAPPSCGDGKITAPEVCDPAVAGSQGCCNPVTCLPFSAGTTCGLERDPCGAPVCDGAGACITRPALLNVRCRDAGAVGPCDPGAVCGAEPYCPNADTATGCEALDFSLATNAAKLKFRCKAKSAARQAVKCAADLVGRPGAALLARGRAGNLQAVPTSDCTGAQFDTTLPKKLAKSGRDELARIIVARINKTDRGYFAPGKTVCVRVRFTTSNGYSQTRLYDVTVP